MKLSLVSKIGIAALFFGVVTLVAAVIENARYYSPTPATQSAFIQRYSPQAVIDSFADRRFNAQNSSGFGSAAGTKFVSNDRDINPTFVVHSEQEASLMVALDRDLLAQLTLNKAEILSQSGDSDRGFRFTYRLDSNLGSAIIQPLVAKSESLSGTPLPVGMLGVTPRIVIREKWFPKVSDALQASRQGR